MTAAGTEDIFISAFQRTVENFPKHAAIVESGSVACSYRQLSDRAKRLAAILQQNNCTRGDVVAISIEKSADYVCAMLAVWYAGAAFSPLDPALPGERLSLMCKEAGVKIALVQSNNIHAHFAAAKIATVAVDQVALMPGEDSDKTADAAAFAPPRYSLDDLAYIIFTSGSTGMPKGVMVTHSGITSFLRAQIEAFDLTSESHSLWYLSTSFDASVSDLGTALLSGAALHIEPACRLQPGAGLEDVLLERSITYVDIPPSMLRLLDPASLPPTLETIVIGGEACALDVVRAFAARVKLVNVYGPTESTVCTSLEQCRTDRDRSLIGRPLPGITYRVLDEDLNEIEAGGSGQLHIGGIGLAAGYLNRPELTAAKFIIHPRTGERLYRTGDLIMLTEDREYQFIGRCDRQVKLRGMLIEPEEIEAKLLQHPGVERAAVLKRPVKEGVSREILVAFVSEKREAPPLNLSDLRSHLAAYLPAWMIPQRLQKVNTMPLTVTGKVDLSALKQIALDRLQTDIRNNGQGRDQSCQFKSQTARTLAQVFAQVLGVDGVEPEDDFFEIGGDSFAVVEAVVAASAMGLSLPPALLMAHPTVSALSAKLESAGQSHALTAVGGMKASEILEDLATIEEAPDFQELMQSASRRPAFALKSPGKVFFTGATGFLGARLLHELLQTTEADFYCLVRAEDENSAISRIQSAMARHGLSPNLGPDSGPDSGCQSQLRSGDSGRRIYPICGRLEKKDFDLPLDKWRMLADEIDTIVHCAAQVNNLASFAELRPSNLLGTLEVARLALSGQPKCLHYAGTLSVFVATDRNIGVLKEDDHLQNTGIVYGGYAQTKWAAEMLLRKLAPLIPTTQHRLGLITGDSKSGRSADHDFLNLFVRGICALGAAPEIDRPVSVDVTPVDFASQAMAALSLQAMQSGIFETYHLANTESLALDRLLSLMQAQGLAIETCPADDFKALLRRRAGSLGPAEAAACLALCRLALDDFDCFRTMDLFQATDAQFDSKAADKILHPKQIFCPPPSDELVETYLRSVLADAVQGSGASSSNGTSPTEPRGQICEE